MCKYNDVYYLVHYDNLGSNLLSKEQITIIQNGVLFLITLFSYGFACGGEFVFDDSQAIVNNVDVMLDSPIEEVFNHDFWGTNITSNSSHKSYRPLTVLSFRLNHYISGGLVPAHMKLTNIALHLIVCLLVRKIYEQILGKSKCKGLFNEEFCSTILFAAHPIHTEAVSSIVGRAEILSAVFYCLAILTYSKAMKDRNAATSVARIIGVCVLTAIALLCKEMGVTALAACGVFDILKNIDNLGIKLTSKHKKFNVSILIKNAELNLKVLFRLVILIIVASLMLYNRWTIMGGQGPEFQRMDNPMAFSDSVIVKILTQNYLYALNAWLLLCPQWLCCDWSFGCIPLLSVLDFRVFTIFLPWIFIIFMLRRSNRVTLMGLALLIAPFLPASGIITVGFVIAERILYLPSIGFTLLVGIGVMKLRRRSKKFIRICYILLILFWCSKAYKRSKEWMDGAVLFESASEVCSNNAKVHYNRARIAADRGYFNESEAFYREAIRLYPDYDHAYNNLGNLLRELNKLEEAESMLQTAVRIRTDFPAAWMNLGVVQVHMGKKDEALFSYNKALQYRSKYADCYYNIGNLHLDKENFAHARAAWEKATKLNPKHMQAWTNLITLLDAKGTREEVVSYGKKALELLPNEPAIHFTLGNSYGKAGQFEIAEDHFKRALEFKKTAVYYANFGVLYHRWNKIDKAKKMYSQALKLDPKQITAKINYNKLSSMKSQ